MLNRLFGKDRRQLYARAFGVLSALALVLSVWLVLNGDKQEEPEPEVAIGLLDQHRPEVGEPAPDFALPDLRRPGNVHRLSEFKGRVVVLNWYASWCGPCRAEIPDFQAAYAANADRLVVLGVNLEESPDVALGLLDELGAEYPAVLDAEGAIAEHYRVSTMPTTYFIDADGTVANVTRGLVTRRALAEELAAMGINVPAE